jgi:hypothetical protein
MRPSSVVADRSTNAAALKDFAGGEGVEHRTCRAQARLVEYVLVRLLEAVAAGRDSSPAAN